MKSSVCLFNNYFTGALTSLYGINTFGKSGKVDFVTIAAVCKTSVSTVNCDVGRFVQNDAFTFKEDVCSVCSSFFDTYSAVGENIYTVRAIGDFGETSDSEAVFIVYNPDKISDVITDSDCVKVQIVNNNIELSATMPLRQIALFTMDGTCLSRQNITGKSYKMPVSQYKKGGYVLACKITGTDKIVVKKILLP